MKREAKQRWKRILSRIKAEGASKEETRVFYTALYHAYLA
ncbi:MAG: glycoside hydrolase domain-containing protein, partial [Butyricimonas paravirosa]